MVPAHDEEGTMQHNWSARCQYNVTRWVSMWAYDMLSHKHSTIKRSLGPTATNGHLIWKIRSPKTEKVQTCFHPRLKKSKLVTLVKITLDVGTALTSNTHPLPALFLCRISLNNKSHDHHLPLYIHEALYVSDLRVQVSSGGAVLHRPRRRLPATDGRLLLPCDESHQLPDRRTAVSTPPTWTCQVILYRPPSDPI